MFDMISTNALNLYQSRFLALMVKCFIALLMIQCYNNLNEEADFCKMLWGKEENVCDQKSPLFM